MRALVIGASGLVGGGVFRVLQRRGAAVAGTYRRHASPGHARLDTADRQAVVRLLNQVRPDWVFYASGLSWVDECERDPARCQVENVELPVLVADEAARLDAGLVYYSTEYIFDGSAGPYDEDSIPNPLSEYGKSKLTAERELAKHVRKLLVLRTTVVYGRELQGKNFVYQLMARVGVGETMAVPDDQISTPTYNPDLAAASVELAECGHTGLFHLAGPDRIDRYSFGVLACRALGLDSSKLVARSTTELGQAAPRPLSAGLVSGRAARLLQTRMRGVEAGLAAFVGSLDREQRHDAPGK